MAQHCVKMPRLLSVDYGQIIYNKLHFVVAYNTCEWGLLNMLCSEEYLNVSMASNLGSELWLLAPYLESEFGYWFEC